MDESRNQSGEMVEGVAGERGFNRPHFPSKRPRKTPKLDTDFDQNIFSTKAA